MNKYKKYYDMLEKQSIIYDKTQNCCIGQTWKHHLMPVINNAIFLAEKYGANKDIVELAAVFHDYANLIDYEDQDNHHIKGAELAKDILIGDGFDEAFVDKVCLCIKTHRASVVFNKFSIEQICVADADAKAHLDNVVELLLWRGYLKEDIQTANAFVKAKIQRSYAKMSENTKELVKSKYDAIMSILF